MYKLIYQILLFWLISTLLVATLQGRTEFWTGDHTFLLKVVRGYIWHHNAYNAQAAMGEALETLPTMDAHCMCHDTKTGV